MYMGELKAFFKEHKGERIVARFQASPAGSSEALKGYYYHYVVPMCQQGLRETGERLTEQQTERKLREWSPICWAETVNIESGKYDLTLREIKDMSNGELLDHLDFVKMFAAENLSVYIDDPRTL